MKCLTPFQLGNATLIMLAWLGLIALTACSSTEPQPFAEYTNAPELTRFVMARDANGRVSFDVLYSDGKVRSGPHRLGNGPDIWNAIGQDAVEISLGEE